MTPGTLYILQGIPGSGKSTIAKLLLGEASRNGYPAVIRSTDEFWYGSTGEYNYDSTKLAEMHRRNQQRVIEDMQRETSVIIVDNTNIKRWQAQPYIVIAKVYDYDLQVIRSEAPLELCIQRQNKRPEDRRVPPEKIREMAAQMESLCYDDL